MISTPRSILAFAIIGFALSGCEKIKDVLDIHKNQISEEDITRIESDIQNKLRSEQRARDITVQLIKIGPYEARGYANYTVSIPEYKGIGIFGGPLYLPEPHKISSECEVNKSEENAEIIWACS